MKKDEIIEMARQAHRKLVTEIYVGHMKQLDPWTIELLKIFAKLVAAKEREACAKVCETKHFSSPVREFGAKECAESIRARGEQANG